MGESRLTNGGAQISLGPPVTPPSSSSPKRHAIRVRKQDAAPLAHTSELESTATSTAVHPTLNGIHNTNGHAAIPEPIINSDPSNEKLETLVLPQATNRHAPNGHAARTLDPDASNEKIEGPIFDCSSVAQPRFSKLKLPERYDYVTDLQTRLWLQSRIPENTMLDEYSWMGSSPTRETSWVNFWLALDLLFILVPAGWTWLRCNGEIMRRLGLFVLGETIGGAISAIELLTTSRLVGLVDDSLQGTVSVKEAVKIGAMSVLFHFLPHVQRSLFRLNKNHLLVLIQKQATRTILAMSLAGTITDSHDALRSSMLLEAASFSGLGGAGYRKPSTLLRTFGLFARLMTTMIAQLGIVYAVLSRTGSIFNWGNALLVAMALAPTVMRRVGKFWSLKRFMATLDQRKDRIDSRKRLDDMERMATSLDTKPETLLYGLGDYILAEHDSAAATVGEKQEDEHLDEIAIELMQSTLQKGMDAMSRVLVVTKKAPEGLSMASMSLMSGALSRSIGALSQFYNYIGDFMNEIFVLAAFNGAYIYAYEPKGEHIDYETHRYRGGGMDLELRDLNFTYPEGEKPSLKGVNLKIAAGETVAIVGANGSGKTTMIKVLLGLYDGHKGLTGAVLINGVPFGDFRSTSIYQRAAVVLQDFKRFPWTLRQNVGVGKISLMHDDEALGQAMTKGGAQTILDKIGLDDTLNPFGFRDTKDEYGPFSGTVTSGKKKKGKGQKAHKTAGEKEEKREGSLSGTAADEDEEDEEDVTDKPSIAARAVSAISSVFFQDHRAVKRRHRALAKNQRQDKHAAMSGGEWQRVALSRAFLRSQDVDVVMFDEPSSNLDAHAEADLFKTLHSLSKSKGEGNSVTTVYVSHRMATVRKAQRIIFMKDGEITEDGTHDSLMALKGGYYEMYCIQRDGFAEE